MGTWLGPLHGVSQTEELAWAPDRSMKSAVAARGASAALTLPLSRSNTKLGEKACPPEDGRRALAASEGCAPSERVRAPLPYGNEEFRLMELNQL
ncbi:hypothetical protein NDU88_011489 [Pleurodeles waltl]|uniref:Uncharacterized protein n=1 Tax=Pleurodeles waltl TaxID=8319 RepID=A0AAV7R353_PLEWA|nr:hypothetical protein NDU88_011489 [Pleurodeles waltl]